MDRDLLDTDEGNIRYRTDKPTDQRSSQNRSRTAHQDGTLPAIDIQGSISSARNGGRRSAVGKATRVASPSSTVVERIPDSRCSRTTGGAVRKRMVSNGSGMAQLGSRTLPKRMVRKVPRVEVAGIDSSAQRTI